jgi:Helix-turn-helix domain
MAKLAKGVRIEGAKRAKLTTQITARYVEGASIRDLADQYGRSYGFIHRIVTESGTPLRGRGGRQPARRKAA